MKEDDGDGDEKPILSLEMAGDQLSGEGQDSCRCQEFSSRVPDEDECILRRTADAREEYLCNIAGSHDFTTVPFFRSGRKSNKVNVIGTASS